MSLLRTSRRESLVQTGARSTQRMAHEKCNETRGEPLGLESPLAYAFNEKHNDEVPPTSPIAT